VLWKETQANNDWFIEAFLKKKDPRILININILFLKTLSIFEKTKISSQKTLVLN